MTVWLVLEEEPSHDEFPCIVLAIYSTPEKATAKRDAMEAAEGADYDPETADKTWTVEQREVDREE